MTDLKPCPFCKYDEGVNFVMTQGDKWGAAECPACCARGPEVRTKYDYSDNAEWWQEAINEWNKRVEPIE